MFGLPESTLVNKSLPKKAIYEMVHSKQKMKKVLDEQISRLTILHEISPKTVNVSSEGEIESIYVVLAHMKRNEYDVQVVKILSDLIDQKMLFALQYEEKIRFGVYRADRVVYSKKKYIDDWNLAINGYKLEAVWDNLIVDTCDIQVSDMLSIDETIIQNEFRENTTKQIELLKSKAINERQPKKKLRLYEAIQNLEKELKGVDE